MTCFQIVLRIPRGILGGTWTQVWNADSFSPLDPQDPDYHLVRGYHLHPNSHDIITCPCIEPIKNDMSRSHLATYFRILCGAPSTGWWSTARCAAPPRGQLWPGQRSYLQKDFMTLGFHGDPPIVLDPGVLREDKQQLSLLRPWYADYGQVGGYNWQATHMKLLLFKDNNRFHGDWAGLELRSSLKWWPSASTALSADAPVRIDITNGM